MNGPTRLREGGGVNARLLASARIDRPTGASRERALLTASTLGSFTATTAGAAAKTAGTSGLYKSVALWICIGALGGGAAALVASQALEPNAAPRTSAEPPPMAPLLAPESPAAARPHPVIAAEPTSAVAANATLLDPARAALARGDTAAALTALDNYDAAHPSGALKPDSAALRIQALRASGDTAAAQRLAIEFEKNYPNHPMIGAVRDGAKAR